MESIENGATIQWNMFTLAFAILAIAFSEIDNKKKENKKSEEMIQNLFVFRRSVPGKWSWDYALTCNR